MKKMIKLRSADNEIFEVEEVVMLQSQTIKFLIEDNCSNDVIPLQNVNSTILTKVIEYCTKHAKNDGNNQSSTNDLKTWDDSFMKVDQKTLYNMIMAASYLEIKNLLDLTCESVANMIRGKTPEEIRKILNIKNDFTPEEEAEIRRKNQWAFEGIE